jgi:hypothetical protein
MGGCLGLVQDLQDDLQLLEVALGLELGKVVVGAHAAEDMAQERLLAIWAVDIDADDQGHG